VSPSASSDENSGRYMSNSSRGCGLWGDGAFVLEAGRAAV
jgi:hypothetical protein